MKILDYKFLIILGLALVVYFIYLEVDYLHKKIITLENDIKNKSKNLENTFEYVNKPILSLPKISDKINKKENVVVSDILPNLNIPSSKTIVLDISPSKIIKQPNYETNIKLTTLINNKKSNTESDSFDVTSSSKHLAIYSNDNEQYDETQNSLLESVDLNKMELNLNSNIELQIGNVESNVNELISMVTSNNESDSETTEKSVEELSIDKNAELKLPSDVNELELNDNKIPSDVNKIELDLELDEKNIHFELDLELDDKNIPSDVNETELNLELDDKNISSDVNELELKKKKISEIKKIAELKKISLIKKVNGQQKQKNKQELINDIIKHKLQ